MFDQLVESTPGGRTRTKKPFTMVVSACLQAVLIAVILIVPLLVTPALPKTLLSSMLLAPPPPAAAAPPPPPQQVRIVKPQARLIEQGKLVAPRSIPKQVNLIKEEELPPDVPTAMGSTGGVVGGVPGGTAGGVLGGIIGGSSTVAPPPPPPPKEVTPTRIQQGGDVQEAMVINKVMPIYPPIARQMRIHGTVRLHAIISKDGHVAELTLVSGPAQLVPAAMDAVKQWRFRPTLLNGTPVEVECIFDIVFEM